MNRHSSNRVKMMKIEIRARNASRKLIDRVRNRLTSNRLGNPNVAVLSDRQTEALEELLARVCHGFHANDNCGSRGAITKVTIIVNISAVAIHAPTNGETVPTLANDSPSNETR